MSRLYLVGVLVTALGAGIIGGVFFAFSTFVMPALARLPPARGIAAMQSINVVVLNRWFLGVFLGTAFASAALAVVAVATWPLPGARLLLGACAAYLLCTFAVTRAFNIPLNDALAATAADSPEGAAFWRRYLQAWTRWNTVRSAAAVASSALFILALLSIVGRARSQIDTLRSRAALASRK